MKIDKPVKIATTFLKLKGLLVINRLLIIGYLYYLKISCLTIS